MAAQMTSAWPWIIPCAALGCGCSSLAGWPRGAACGVGQGCLGLGTSRKLFLFFLFLSLWLLVSFGKKAVRFAVKEKGYT